MVSTLAYAQTRSALGCGPLHMRRPRRAASFAARASTMPRPIAPDHVMPRRPAPPWIGLQCSFSQERVNFRTASPSGEDIFEACIVILPQTEHVAGYPGRRRGWKKKPRGRATGVGRQHSRRSGIADTSAGRAIEQPKPKRGTLHTSRSMPSFPQHVGVHHAQPTISDHSLPWRSSPPAEVVRTHVHFRRRFGETGRWCGEKR